MDCSSLNMGVLAFLMAFLAELSFASLSFGSAIVYQVSWQIASIVGVVQGGIEEALSSIVVVELPTALCQAFRLKGHLKPRLTAIFVLPFLLGLPFSTLLLIHVGKADWMKVCMGLFLLLFAALQYWKNSLGFWGAKPSLDVEDSRTWHTFFAIVSAVLLSSVFRGLFGVAGPPQMVLLTFYGFEDHDNLRLIAATQRTCGSLIQAVELALNRDYALMCWPKYLAFIVGGFCGLGVGNRIAVHVNKDMVQNWISLFLVACALLMVAAGFPSVPALGAAAALIVATAMAALVFNAFLTRKGVAAREHQVALVGHATGSAARP